MCNILFIHQSSELYGSDRVFLSLVKRIDKRKYTPVVLLPSIGPLLNELEKSDIQCHIIPMLRAGRTLFSFKGVLAAPYRAFRSVRAINNVIAVWLTEAGLNCFCIFVASS